MNNIFSQFFEKPRSLFDISRGGSLHKFFHCPHRNHISESGTSAISIMLFPRTWSATIMFFRKFIIYICML
jgi:hypothetical protein